MIGRLKGTIAHEALDGVVVVDVQGVGYEVLIPLGTLGHAPRDSDGRVTLMIHTQVREDAITLFGFANENERTAFRMLTTVTGVGPKTAVMILGVLPVNELAAVLARGDSKRLTAVPGVGKKIAERLVLELKDKLTPAAVRDGTAGTAVPAASNGAATATAASASLTGLEKVVDVLVRMGFKQVEAERAVIELKGRESEPVEILVRESLRLLAR